MNVIDIWDVLWGFEVWSYKDQQQKSYLKD